MRTRQFLAAFVLMTFALVIAGEVEPHPEASDANRPDSASSVAIKDDGGRVIVYYFHGNRRCATCQKLEAYSFEALHNDFKAALEDSSIVWQVVNFESDGNEHFTQDYKLFTQSLILSRVVDGKEVEWKNLDQIWRLVGDKEKFLSYVSTATRNFWVNEPK